MGIHPYVERTEATKSGAGKPGHSCCIASFGMGYLAWSTLDLRESADQFALAVAQNEKIDSQVACCAGAGPSMWLWHSLEKKLPPSCALVWFT